MSNTITVVQVGAVGAAAAQASAAQALAYRDTTATLKGQVDTAKGQVDVAKAAVDVAKGQVDVAKEAVDVAKGQVDAAQSDVIARQAVVVAAQGVTETARDTAVAQAGVATAKAAEASGSASMALAVYGTSEGLNAAQQIMLGYANTAQAQAGLAATMASSAASVAQQDLSGVTAAALHRSPNAVTAMCFYDTSKDSDGGAWVERCTNTSWFQEALNGTWLPGGFASEMDARDYLGSYQAASIVTGDSSNFAGGVGTWAGVANGTPTAVSGRLRLTQTGALGTTMQCSLALPTVVGQRYQVALDIVTPQSSAQNLWWGVGTTPGGSQLAASVSMGNAALPRRLISFVATGTTSYLWIGGTTSWAQNSYAEIDDITVKPVSFSANPSGAFYQLTTDGKFYRLWRNLLANSGFAGGTSGTWGSGAVPPTGWQGTVGNGTITIQASTTPNRPGNSIRYQATAQRPQLYQIFALPAYASAVFSVYVETLASGTPKIRDIALPNPVPSGAAVTYRKNGSAAVSTDTVTTGDFVEAIVTTAGTSGNCYFQHGLGCQANITADITLSPPQVEYVATAATPATAYEVKAVGIGAQTETFRGNKAKFPRFAAIVVESGATTIYDLTEPGRPMWMRFVGGYLAQAPVGSVAIANAELVFGGNSMFGFLRRVNFLSERVTSHRAIASGNSSEGFFLGNIAQRNSVNLYSNKSGGNQVAALAGEYINGVAMIVRKNAPVDPVTGLPVPVVACAVGSGNAGNLASLILENGSVVSITQGSNDGTHVAFTDREELVLSISTGSAAYVGPIFTSNVTGLVNWTGSRAYASAWSATGVASVGGTNKLTRSFGPAGLATFSRGSAPLNVLALVRDNPANGGAALEANIASAYNTGWMAGDIRRCWLAGVAAGAISATQELVTDGTFDNAGTASLWTTQDSNVTRSVAGGVMSVSTDVNAASDSVYYNVATELGAQFTFTINFTLGANATGVYLQVRDGSVSGAIATATGNVGTGTASSSGTATCTFTALGSSSFVRVIMVKTQNDAAITYDNATCKAVAIPDRSYKAKPATIYGTLARTAVAAAAQIVFHAGWSAANYYQEAYSADLDPATGSLAVRAWGTIPTNVGAAGWAFDRSAAGGGAYYRLGHSATGQIVGELYDGATTRTVTTTATYATGLALEFGMEYVPNGASSTLTLKVNGRQVAQSTFAALNTLSNATAVATVGIDRALAAPWAGGLALLKVGMTAASANASGWMFEQEKHMFRPGAQVTLPSTGTLLDVSYDEATDTVSVVDAANEAHFCGVVRVSTAAVPAGSFSKVARGGGLKLVARTGTAPGVDVTIPAQNLREELVNRELAAARRVRLTRVFDFDSVTSQVDFPLPAGWEAVEVISAGASKREGSTKDWIRVYDGFVETVRFGVSPGNGTWVQATARRSA